VPFSVIDPDDLLAPRPRLSMGAEAYEQIRRQIVEGVLRPGERIVEDRLAKSLSISRTPVREALQRLEGEHLLVRVDRGLVVSSYSPAEIRDLFDLRVQVECYAAGLAAERMLAPDAERLQRGHEAFVVAVHDERQRDLEWLRRLTTLNQRFHFDVARAAHHAGLQRTITQVVQTPLVYRATVWFDDDHRRRSTREHAELLERLLARDVAGAQVTWRRHLETARDVVAGRLDASERHGEPV
jgi:DNA-binding GntR family transcriptional regulator